MNDIIPSSPSQGETASYRLPWQVVAGGLAATLALRPRSFARDARAAVAGLRPPPEVRGAENVPVCGPVLLTCNHYSRPGFDAWWLALAISAAVAAQRAPDADPEIHWLMTAAWTFPESPWRRRWLTPLTRWAFRRVAQVYGFIPMPPMPPVPDEVEERAQVVLATLRLARRMAKAGGMVGLAPEGRDTPGQLGDPPEGAGRFIAMLVEAGLPVLPAGVAEAEGRLRVSFGPSFNPCIPSSKHERDRAVVWRVMEAIACQLPA